MTPEWSFWFSQVRILRFFEQPPFLAPNTAWKTTVFLLRNKSNVYSADEKVLFDTDKANIKLGAAEAPKQITGSIGQRYAASQVRVMGFADSRGDKSYNRELSEKRAEAVKNYLVAKGSIDAARVSIEPMGETQPVASNATAAGRQKNRRVEIAVRTK